MREILFRGKHTDNGKWVEGELLHDMQDRPHIYWKTPKELPIVFSNHAIVRPKTVGQFTGLTDKNGKKIFEGDILSECGSLFAVVYDVKWARFHLKYIGRCIQYPEWNRGVQMEIVGNIHDNPELLEGGGKDG